MRTGHCIDIVKVKGHSIVYYKGNSNIRGYCNKRGYYNIRAYYNIRGYCIIRGHCNINNGYIFYVTFMEVYVLLYKE